MFTETKEIFLYVMLFLSLYFQVFLFISYILWNRKTEQGDEDIPATEIFEPVVVVMVPCWNEEKTVAKTVDSLLEMDYPREKLRVLVIDDGSTDGTWQVLQQYANNPSVALLQKENEGSKFAALNAGLRYVNNNIPEAGIIGCLDADSRVHVQALRESLLEFTKPHVMAVVPSMVIDQPQTFFQWMQKVEYEIATYAKQALARLNTLYIAPGPFTLFRKTVFDILGEYHEAHHVEDMEIAVRMQLHNMRLSHAVHSLVYTKGPRNWPALFKQRVRWTYGFIMNAWDYRGEFFKPQMGHAAVTIPMLLALLMLSVVAFPILIIAMVTPIITFIRNGIVSEQWIPVFSFDWVTINTKAYALIGILMIGFMLMSIIIGRKKLLKKNIFSLDLLTLSIYPIFAGAWTLQSVYNALRGKKKTWR